MALRQIPPDEIIVGDRHRKDMGDIDALAASIQSLNCLLHPIVVDKDLRLIAGERRLEAVKKLGWPKVPANVVTSLTEATKLIEAERDENTCRKDFTPSEAVALGKRLEDLLRPAAEQSKQEGRSKGGKTAGKGRPKANSLQEKNLEAKPDPQVRDKVGASVGMSGRTYEKAKAVVDSGDKEAIEQMDKTGKVGPAFNRVKQKEKQKELQRKAKQTKQGAKQANWKLIQADVIDGLQQILDSGQLARLVFADPPYNIGIDYGQGEKADKIPPATYMLWVKEWLDMCVSCLLPDGSLWVMIGDEYAAEYATTLKGLGLTIRSWIKWYETFGVNCTGNFNRTSRHILYCVKERKRFVFNEHAVTRQSDRQAKYNDKRANEAGKLWDDVWMIPRLSGTCNERIPDFPTQLPLAVVRPIVECASEPSDLVIDPFSGSGTTGVACIETGRKYIGIERSDEFVSLSTIRLQGVGAL